MHVHGRSMVQGFLLALAAMVTFGCGGSSSSGGSPQPAPTISSFTASPAAIPAGSSSTLSWSVSGATSLSIDQGIGTVTGSSRSVSPAATTTYTLTASNAAGSASATATVTVVPAPVIGSFTATPPSIAPGGSSTLAWTVTGATGLSLDQGIGAVTGTSRGVSPSVSTTYTLTAVNTVGGVTATATATATVTVVVPSLLNFGAAPDGTATGYPNVYGIIQPAQTGAFPTLKAHNGARTQSTADGILGTLAALTADAILGDYSDADGLQNMVVVLTSIPPPAAITVKVTAPAGSSGGTMYLNVLFDKNMNGVWDGASEWVVKNQAVTLPAAGTSMNVTPPAFAFSNGNILPDPAWMRIALTREQINAATWDGSGLFSSGEIEDYLVFLPALPGPPIKKVPILTVETGGPYVFPLGVGNLPVSFTVKNWAPVAGNYTYSFTKLDGNVVLNLPFAPASPVPIASFDLVLGTPASSTVNGTATSPNPAALPSDWAVNVSPVDPPFWMNAYGVYIGEGSTSGTLAFTGTSPIVSHSVAPITENLTHVRGSSPCPTPFSPILITNTGNVPLVYSTTNPMAFVTLDKTAGSIAVGSSDTLYPSFPCTGYALGPNTGTLSIAVQSSTGTPSSGPGTVLFNLTVQDPPPTSLTYSANPAVYTVGTPIPANTPSHGGGPVDSYSVYPALPAGLSLNPTTGVISGTPTAVTPTATYTVTATNTGGSTSVGLVITVHA